MPLSRLSPLAVLLFATAALAQDAAQTVTMAVDLREAPRGILHVALDLPVKPGPLTLAYPQWLPGEHAPTGPVENLTNLTFSAAGQPITWRRDLTDAYKVNLTIPPGVDRLSIRADYLAPLSAGGYSAGPTSSPRLVVLNWNLLTLLPAGVDAATLRVQPAIALPPDWRFGTALTPAKAAPGAAANATVFEPCSFETLVDSPVLAGLHFRTVDLTPGQTPTHTIEIAADTPDAFAIPEQRLAALRRIPAEFAALFGTRHYRHYTFLLALSDRTAWNGIEHHESSDNRFPERGLIDDDTFFFGAAVLTHEYFHSWNGKHRRPARLLSPDFQKPMQDDLLWVYEGLTEYYGNVMAARTGALSPENYREYIAHYAQICERSAGRTWRPLQDTADFAPRLYSAPRQWQSRRRGTEFYIEGALLWLDADTLIREKTNNAKSLDDFCRAFYAGGNLQGQAPTVKPYDAPDVFAALHAIVPDVDWAAFFNERLQSLSAAAPTDGLRRGGYTLVYTDVPNKLGDLWARSDKLIDHTASLGMFIGADDFVIADVVPGSPADKAGLSPGMTIVAVNGRKATAELLSDAVKATPVSKSLELLIEHATFFTTAKLTYDGGLRYPHLVRNDALPDRLADTIRPLAK